MSHTVAIILRFREEAAERFESLFAAEIYPLWEEFKAQDKVIAASLTRVQDGNRSGWSQLKEGVRDHILHFEAPSIAEHNAFDTDPRFLSFLEKVQLLQPEEPGVWLGETLFQI